MVWERLQSKGIVRSAMELPPPPLCIADLEARQDEVLRALDELNERLEHALKAYQRQFKLVSDASPPLSPSTRGPCASQITCAAP
jgi:hypothetical protein